MSRSSRAAAIISSAATRPWQSRSKTFRALGGETLILTNAAGGLNKEWPPPSLVAIPDHINFSGTNPLIGHPGKDSFVPLTHAYD